MWLRQRRSQLPCYDAAPRRLDYEIPGEPESERQLPRDDPSPEADGRSPHPGNQASTYKDFAGRYEISVRSLPVILSVETDGGKLVANAGGTRLELLPESPLRFSR
jgi:hypothetical protein